MTLYYLEILKWFALIPRSHRHPSHPARAIWQPFTYIFLHDPRSLFHIAHQHAHVVDVRPRPRTQLGKGAACLNSFSSAESALLLAVEQCVKAVPYLFFGRQLSITPTIGASGAIFGILMANAVLFPDRKIWLIPLPISIRMRPYVAAQGRHRVFLHARQRRRQRRNTSAISAACSSPTSTSVAALSSTASATPSVIGNTSATKSASRSTSTNTNKTYPAAPDNWVN